jgi:hypothetical protein
MTSSDFASAAYLVRDFPALTTRRRIPSPRKELWRRAASRMAPARKKDRCLGKSVSSQVRFPLPQLL